MKEMVTTAIYVGVAIAVVLAAVLTYPKQEEFEPPDLVGKPLFAEFTDPAQAAEMQILSFREDDGRMTEFVVARDPATGLWVIPSSGNYPADAEAQMRDAATSLIDLQVLGVASESARDHQIYGVLEPAKQMDSSQEGVGLLVTVKDAKKRDLAKLIIGKRVKGEGEQHFARKPGIDSVCVVKITPDKFPTDFPRWIERDLLKINTLDIADVTLRDYSLIKTQTVSGTSEKLQERVEAQLSYNPRENTWSLAKLLQFRNGQPQPTGLLDAEELNLERLEALVTALADMKILDVHRKPARLGADLEAGAGAVASEETLSSLRSRGFQMMPGPNGESHLRAANGEVLIGLDSGVQYVLRFGGIADMVLPSEAGKLSRYLLVSVRLDESKFPPLQLEAMPGGEATAAAVGSEKSDLELQRERVRRENQRRQDEREEKLRKANQKIAELNARFADWYYVISEDEYKRVRLGRNELIRESAAAREQGFGIDAFRYLQEQGLKKPPSEPQPPRPPVTPSGSRTGPAGRQAGGENRSLPHDQWALAVLESYPTVASAPASRDKWTHPCS